MENINDEWKKITTAEAAFKWKGIDMHSFIPDVSVVPQKYRNYIIACCVLPVVIDAVNNGWKSDYAKDDRKFAILCECGKDLDNARPSCFGFSDELDSFFLKNEYEGRCTDLESIEKSFHVIENFLPLLKDYYIKEVFLYNY